jgi:mono/diheme cytochrome c family protein
MAAAAGGELQGCAAARRSLPAALILGLLLVILAIAGLLSWWITAPRPAFPETTSADLDRGGDPARGELVFDAGDCASCHASRCGPRSRVRISGVATPRLTEKFYLRFQAGGWSKGPTGFRH